MVMMDNTNWRRTQQKGDSSYRQQQQQQQQQQHDFQRSGSFNRRSQSAPGSWDTSVPLWEKKFCSAIGRISWHKFLEMKKYAHLDDNIVQWNDSASKEAFDNAKYKFWAQINGRPCDISLPSPDIYIDDIDWNSEVDPELILDLEREPDVADDHEEVSIDSTSPLLNQPVPCSGWGDEEDYQDKGINNAESAGFNECGKHAIYNDNAWENSCPQNNGNTSDLQWRWNNWEDNVCGYQKFDDRRTTWNSNQKYGEDSNMSRYKTSRFHVDDYQMDQRWRNNGNRREPLNRVREDRKPISGQWKIISS